MLQYSPMATLALLLGGECTGKTSLAYALAGRFPPGRVIIVPEVLRDFVTRVGRPPERHEQRDIWLEQTRLLSQAVGDHDSLIVCDPAPVMTAVYSLQYFDDDSLLEAAIEATDAADIVVWCTPDLPWQPDGAQRDGPHARQRTHEILETIVVPRLSRTRVLPVVGGIADRTEQVRAHLP